MAQWAVRVAGVYQTIKSPSVRVAGVYQPIKQGWVRVAGVWKEFFALVVNVVAAPSSASATGQGPITLTTGFVTATPSGGSGVYPTYLWSFISGGAGITITSPNAATTAFTAGLAAGQNVNGVAVCTVTDSNGTVGVSNTVGVHLTATN